METPVPYQLSKVLEKTPADWRGRYCALVPEFLQTRARPFLGEDVTSFMREREVGEPPDANAWGAMFNATIAKSGFAIRTGRTRLAKAGKSHAHAFREWQSTICPQPDRLMTMHQELMAIRSKFHLKKIDLWGALVRAAEVGASSLS